MRGVFGLFLLAALAITGCSGSTHVTRSSGLTPEQRQAITDAVRHFMNDVAQDITKDGPSAWRKHFEDDPAFFMAVNGVLAFSDSQSAAGGIQDASRNFKRIELHWGNEVRVDPLSNTLAMVATPYHEVLATAEGKQITSDGFFTALAELRAASQWQFRNVHWSVPPVPPAPTGGS